MSLWVQKGAKAIVSGAILLVSLSVYNSFAHAEGGDVQSLPAHALLYKTASDPSIYGPLLSGEVGALSAKDKQQLKDMVLALQTPLPPAQVLTEKTSASGYTFNTSAEECAACHMLEYLQWEEGRNADLIATELYTGGTKVAAMHRLALLDETFHKHFVEYGSLDSCQRCHVPSTVFTADRNRAVYAPESRTLNSINAEEGVTCVSCHLDDKGVIRGEHNYGEGEADHIVEASPEMFDDGVTLCQSCHGDPFWGALSNTVKEWEEQAADTGLTCVSCHMISLDDWESESHAFPGAHSPTMLDEAIQVTLPRSLQPNKNFTIQACNAYAGHNLPTGDQFRAYSLAVTVQSGPSTVFEHTKYISPRFNAIVIQEKVDYDRTDPLPFGACVDLPYDSLRSGTYTVTFELGFWLLKPTTLEVIVPALGSATTPGEVYQTIYTDQYQLVVSGNEDDDRTQLLEKIETP